MKILDRYILTTYLKTFISVFLILVLIFILQTLWLYIKELAGKDLDLIIIAKFLLYFLPKLMPLVIPLTILLSSIMVFGNFAENYEFAAMKSTGISLQRAMTGLSVFIVGLAITTFFFSNNVIPWAEYNSLNLRINIKKTKPAMAIAEGQFNQIGNEFNIKVEKKIDDRYLENVTIHQKGADKRTNTTIIRSKTGEIISKETSNIVKLVLYDGNYYSDVNPIKPEKPFAKSTFEKYIINIDVSGVGEVDFDEKTATDRHNMLNINGLLKTIDSLEKKKDDEYKSLSDVLMRRSSVAEKTKINKKTKKQIQDRLKSETDSIFRGEILDLFNTRKKIEMIDVASRGLISAKQIISTKKTPFKQERKNLNQHYMSLHEKFALGFACIILFFVGAPLGALIRKGGIGLPMVIAIILFLTYHFIGIFAKNSAKNGEFNPVLASWFSTLIMLPLSIFLTRRATADRNLFEFGSISEPLRKIFKIKEKGSVDYKFLRSLKNEELINIIDNYESLGHEENVRFEAIKVLNDNGVDIEQLRNHGIRIDKKHDTTREISSNYNDHSRFAIILYTVGAVLLILFFVFKNNKLPYLASASIQLSIVSFLLFVIYYVKSILNLFQFNLHLKKEKKPNLFLLILGAPFYMLAYPFLNVKIKEDLRLNCLDSLK